PRDRTERPTAPAPPPPHSRAYTGDLTLDQRSRADLRRPAPRPGGPRPSLPAPPSRTVRPTHSATDSSPARTLPRNPEPRRRTPRPPLDRATLPASAATRAAPRRHRTAALRRSADAIPDPAVTAAQAPPRPTQDQPASIELSRRA